MSTPLDPTQLPIEPDPDELLDPEAPPPPDDPDLTGYVTFDPRDPETAHPGQ